MSYLGHNLAVMSMEGADGLHMVGVYFCDSFLSVVSSLGERDYFFIFVLLVPRLVNH